MSKLLRNSSDLRTLLSENASFVLVAVGIALTIIGLMTFSMNTSMSTIATLYSGISSILLGFLIKIGLLTFDTSLQGVRSQYVQSSLTIIVWTKAVSAIS